MLRILEKNSSPQDGWVLTVLNSWPGRSWGDWA